MLNPKFALVACAVCAGALAAPAWASPTAIQDFEDGTTQGWTVGGFFPSGPHPAPPVVVTGGPGGATDKYLQLTAVGGSGPGSRLSAFSATWSGDFATAGLTTIAMDLRNFGVTELHVRLVLEDLSDLTQPHFAITDAVFVPVGSGWMSGSFSVAAQDLTQLQGDVGDVLRSVTRLRIVANGDSSSLFSPLVQPPLTGLMGVDNITPNVFGSGGGGGTGVPEPATVWLLALGVLGLGGLRAVRAR